MSFKETYVFDSLNVNETNTILKYQSCTGN